MTEGKYILDAEHNAVPERDLRAWGEWMETADRTVKKTFVGNKWVSTVFLGMDHAFFDAGAPLLFETMVFPAKNGKVESFADERCERYSTWDEALAGHEAIVKEISGG